MRLKALFIFLLCIPSVTYAFDIETQNVLIEKIEGSLAARNDQTVEQDLLLVRLADLYAERARYKAIQEAEKNCKNCESSKSDRLNAIKYYQRAESTPDNRVYSKVVLQLNHLYKMEGQWDKAYRTLTKSLKKITERDIKALINFEIAEYHFSNKKYKEAKADYQRSLIGSHHKKSQAIYKLAWSNYHLGHTKTSIKLLGQILRNPELLKSEQSEDSTYDEAYHEIVAKDYANIRTQYVVNSRVLEEVYKLSPESSHQVILSAMANELTRLGRYKESTAVWAFALARVKLNESEKLSMWLNKIEGELATRNFTAAVKSYEKAVEVAHSIKGDSSKEARTKVRNTLIRWHKLEAKKPSNNLYNAYAAYLNHFTDDVEMYSWASDVAFKTDKIPAAKTWLRKSAEVAKNQKQKEDMLMTELLMVENVKDSGIKLDTYNFYLAKSKNDEKSLEVLYQKAFLLFQKKKYQESAPLFERVASANNSKLLNLRTKAARLEIEALIKLKKDDDIVKKASIYKKEFKAEQAFFEEQRVQGILNLAFKSEKNSSKTQKQLIFSQLKSIPIKKQNKSTQKTIFRHLIAYSDELNELGLVEAYTRLAINSKLFNGKEEARISNKYLWSLEMQLKFSKAHKAISSKKLKTESDLLKSAVIAELAGRPSKESLTQFIKKTSSRKKANAVRAYLIEISRSPWSLIKEYKYQLMRTPEIWANVVLETYLRTGAKSQVRKIVKTLSVNSFERQFIERDLVIDGEIALINKAKRHKFNRRSQYLLNKSITQRVEFLTQIEKKIKEANKRKDVFSEVMLAQALADLNQKTGKQILKLPEPKGLSVAERKQYAQLIKAKTKTFFDKEKYLKRAVAKTVRSKSIKSNIKNAITSLNAKYTVQLKRHFRKLDHRVPSEFSSFIDRSISALPERPSHREVQIAWSSMKSSPFEASKVEKVLEMEKQRGKELIVGYLNVRKEQLQRRSKQ